MSTLHIVVPLDDWGSPKWWLAQVGTSVRALRSEVGEPSRAFRLVEIETEGSES